MRAFFLVGLVFSFTREKKRNGGQDWSKMGRKLMSQGQTERSSRRTAVILSFAARLSFAPACASTERALGGVELVEGGVDCCCLPSCWGSERVRTFAGADLGMSKIGSTFERELERCDRWLGRLSERC